MSRQRASALLERSAILVCGLSICGGALAQLPPTPAQTPTLTVAGNGEVSVDPDSAVVRLGVVAEAEEAAAAQDQVNSTMEAILAAITALDVPERAVQTEQLSLNPVYGPVRPRPDQQGPEDPRITGYRASSVVSVELDDISRVGTIVDAGIMAGANQLQGVSFQLRDSGAARAEALGAAVADARARADAIAAALDLGIAGIRDVVAGDAFMRPPMPVQARFDVAELASTPVRPGQVDLSATVTVTYLLRAQSGAER